MDRITYDKLAQALGDFVIEFARLEVSIDETIRGLVWFAADEQQVTIGDFALYPDEEESAEEEASRDSIMAAFAADLDFNRKVQLLRSLAEARIPNRNLDELRKLTGKCLKLGNTRNDLLHSAWVIQDGQVGRERRLRSSVNRKATLAFTPEDAVTLLNKKKKLSDLIDKFDEWRERNIFVTTIEIRKIASSDNIDRTEQSAIKENNEIV